MLVDTASKNDEQNARKAASGSHIDITGTQSVVLIASTKESELNTDVE